MIPIALRFGDIVQIGVYHTKLFTSPWQTLATATLTLTGLNLDAVWQNIVSSIGEVEVAQGKSLSDQIKIDEERAKILRQIETMERQMRSTYQNRRQNETYAQNKELKIIFYERNKSEH